MSVENLLEDAFQATVSFATPRDVVILDFVVNQTRNGEVSTNQKGSTNFMQQIHGF